MAAAARGGDRHTAQGLDPEGSQGIHSCPQELVYPEGGNQSNMVGNP